MRAKLCKQFLSQPALPLEQVISALQEERRREERARELPAQ